MAEPNAPSPIVVGIDGSKASLRAAAWAADEAADRDVVLRLVHVVDPDADDIDEALANGRHMLLAAWTLVQSTGAQVKLESDILFGDPGQELVTASGAAQLVCVGYQGMRDSMTGQRGSTAAYVARHADSPVAVVRRRHTRKPSPFHQWILAVLDEQPGCDTVLQTAIDEAQLRDAPILALTSWSTSSPARERPHPERGLRATLERYLDETLHDCEAGIQMCAIPISDDLLNVLNQSATIDQLVIVGSADTDRIEQLLGRRGRKLLRHTNCSFLIGPDRRS